MSLNFVPIGDQKIRCAYEWKGETWSQELEYNKPYSTPAFSISVSRNGKGKVLAESYELIIRNKLTVAKAMEKRIRIDAENTYGGKIVIEYTDVNDQRAKDVVNTIADAIVTNGLERKSS